MKIAEVEIPLIFENDDFIVVDKPIGLEFEGSHGVLANLRVKYREIFGVHRLDKATSGLMLFAKTKDVQKALSELFAQKLVSKTYLALSLHRPSKKMGSIKGDLEKGRGGSYRLLRSNKNPSHTKFQSYYLEKAELRAFLLHPITGQTHQLRVHLKSIGSPILGDERYGSDKSDRTYLACIKLSFLLNDKKFEFTHHPVVGEYFLSDEISEIL